MRDMAQDTARTIIRGQGFRDELVVSTVRLPTGRWLGRVDLTRITTDAKSGAFRRARYYAHVLPERNGIREVVMRFAELYVEWYRQGVVGLDGFNMRKGDCDV